MDSTVLIVLVVLVGLILLNVPIAFSLLVSGMLGILLLQGAGVTGAALGTIPYAATESYSLILIPLFIFMGTLLSQTGIAERMFKTGNLLVGRLRGGLPLTAIFAGTLFGGVSGSSAADAATIGRISIGEMRRYGYPAHYAAAVVAATATVSILIPPSIVLVLYGIITQESIGALLLAGFIPGLITSLLYAAWVIAVSPWYRRSGRAVDDAAGIEPTPAVPEALRPASRRTWLTTIGALSGGAYTAVIFLVVVGGIYAGVFTATESAAVGTFVAILLGLFRMRGRPGKLRALKDSLTETVATSSMVFTILIGGAVFAFFILRSGMPSTFTSWIISLDLPPIVVVLLLIAAMLPLGMILDGLSMLLIVVPLTYPVITALGFDGIWFGIILVVTVEVGLLTPPVGINVFITSGLVKGLQVEKVFLHVVPFILLNGVMIGLLIAFPEIALWLPALMVR